MKSTFNKTIFSILTVAVLLLSAGSAKAAQLTQSQMQAVIGLLQSFNVDQTTINSVTVSLGGGVVPNPIPAPVPWCPSLSYNLYVGVTDNVTGGQVSQLQQYLNINPTGYFGTITRGRVASLQSQYGVYPVSGGVGPLTRALIQKLCSGVVITPPPTPIATSFSLRTPFALNVGQTGTEISLRQLTLQIDSINSNTAQVTMGESCIPGTQCFYYPHQTIVMTPNQPILFQGYTIALTNISNPPIPYSMNSVPPTNLQAIFYVTKDLVSTITPLINSITPTSGPTGTVVTMYGSGFTQDNTVHFGSGGAMHVASSNGGTMLTYTIPQGVGPCDYVGDTSLVRCMVAIQQVQPGMYNISVSNSNGQSGTLPFSVTSQTNTSHVSFTQPTTGQTYVRGQDLPISWSATNIPQDASITLDLYTETGSKVGTIAIPRNDAASYSWHIPGFPQNYMCTMQYPNGLCGVSIPTGRYYMMATVTSNTSIPSNATALYGTAVSGVFTINQQ